MKNAAHKNVLNYDSGTLLPNEEQIQKVTLSNNINLIGGFKRKTVNTVEKYKDEYKRLPVKMSSSGFLVVYVLHTLIELDRPVYGIEILDKISETYDSNIWAPKHSTLYPVLKKMVNDGLIELSYKDNLKRKYYYSITDLGRQQYEVEKKKIEGVVKGSKTFFEDLYKELF